MEHAFRFGYVTGFQYLLSDTLIWACQSPWCVLMRLPRSPECEPIIEWFTKEIRQHAFRQFVWMSSRTTNQPFVTPFCFRWASFGRGLEVCQIVLLILIQNELFTIFVLVYCSCFEHFCHRWRHPHPLSLSIFCHVPISSFYMCSFLSGYVIVSKSPVFI